MPRVSLILSLSLFLALALATAAPAKVAVNPLFSSDMVLQRDAPVPVWGQDLPGQSITVTFNGQRQTTTTTPQGRWMIRLPKMSAGGPFTMSVRGSGPELTLTNVMVGDVWLCSGQSNMQTTLNDHVDNKEVEAATADRYPRIRLFTVHKLGGYAAQPSPAVGGGPWAVCSAASVKKFSAVGFFFGRQLQDSSLAGVPLGLIDSSVGATLAEMWISKPALTQAYGPGLPGLRPDKAFGHPISGCFNGMIHPLIPFALRGVIWYQGESNCAYPGQYLELFPLLIREWRTLWQSPRLPFLFVQLPGFAQNFDNPPTPFTGLREAQLRTWQHVPATGMAVTIDLGDPKDVHPSHKQEVGRRLALLARALVYGEKLVYSGPIYKRMVEEGGAVRVYFDHTGGGLKSKTPGALRGFEVAGDDEVFHPATAAIDGETVLAESREVPSPRHVRYAWAPDPAADLVNAEGLPASPFRCDPPPPSAMAADLWKRAQ